LGACWVNEADIQRKLSAVDDVIPVVPPEVSEPVVEHETAVVVDSAVSVEETVDPGDVSMGDDRPPPVMDSLSCADVQLGLVVGPGVSGGDAVLWSDDFLGTCHPGDSGGDLTFGWRAPTTGCWRVDTHGSTLDTLLYAYDGCGGAEIACQDDSAAGTILSSQVTMALEAGQAVLWAVDTYSAEAQATGNFLLNIQTWSALIGDVDLGSALSQPVSGDNTGADTTLRPSGCPLDSGADVLVSWVAPWSGIFQASLVGSEFDTVLSLHEPCDPVGLICVDVETPGGEVLQFQASEGETAVFRVAGGVDNGEAASGTWRLQIDELIP
jgi:hypothetical protein